MKHLEGNANASVPVIKYRINGSACGGRRNEEVGFVSVSRALHRRTIVLVDRLERYHREILLFWTVLVSAACGLRLSFGPFDRLPLDLQIASALPYLLVVGAPVVSVLLAWNWFRRGDRLPQPSFRLARTGRWRPVSLADARSLPYFGVSGIMASLLLGLLIHVLVRTIEFLAAMPPLGAAPPGWFRTLYSLFLADCVLLTSLLAVAFVAALRRVPLFPRLLVAIWCIDIMMQVSTARVMAGVDDLPPPVAQALAQLLEGNLYKVLISAALWTPYLLLSKRVNLTFRLRVPA